MLIKELKDMLALVAELPSDTQLQCAQALFTYVEEWEERQQEPHLSDAEWADLKAHRAEARRRRDDLRNFADMGLEAEPRSGVVESYDDKKGYGYILMENEDRALLHVTCLRACGYRHARVGAHVEFLAVHRTKGWQAFRILSLAK